MGTDSRLHISRFVSAATRSSNAAALFRFPETATHSSLARIGVQLQQVLNVEPDLTISLLTFACLLVVLVLLLVSISAARRSQYKKRQALDRKDISERKDLVLGNRSAALTMRRRLESLLADLIEQRLCKQENNKVLALQPEQLESMLAEIPRGTLQPQAFENAFGVLHELSLQLNSFSSMASHEYHETTKDLAVEISRLQKEILTTLAPVKQRLQVCKNRYFTTLMRAATTMKLLQLIPFAQVSSSAPGFCAWLFLLLAFLLATSINGPCDSTKNDYFMSMAAAGGICYAYSIVID